MKGEAAGILKAALALPPEARAALAGSLLDSFDTDIGEDIAAAWAAEVNRRVAELDSGRTRRFPGPSFVAGSPLSMSLPDVLFCEHIPTRTGSIRLPVLCRMSTCPISCNSK